jgi:hypothetical protein
MDELVHQHVFGKEIKGRAPGYSGNLSLAVKILDVMPVFVGQLHKLDPRYNVARPFFAGYEAGWADDFTITSDTPHKALCKAALFIRRGQEDAARDKQAKAGNKEAAPDGTATPSP